MTMEERDTLQPLLDQLKRTARELPADSPYRPRVVAQARLYRVVLGLPILQAVGR
jgi:hypothetical protein